jgi:hypothetical protein
MTSKRLEENQMLPSPRSIKYFDALIREGDNFNFDRWLRQVRAEEAAIAGETVGQVYSTSAHVVPSVAADRVDRQPTQSRVLTVSRVHKVKAKLQPAATPGNDALKDKIMRVSDAWDEYSEDRSRDAVYKYLRRVYAVVVESSREGEIGRLMQVATSFGGLPHERGAEPFTAVIRCTCEKSLDAKAISKFSRALRYAAYRTRPPRKLKSFIKGLGGINAAANRYAKKLGKGR